MVLEIPVHCWASVSLDESKEVHRSDRFLSAESRHGSSALWELQPIPFLAMSPSGPHWQKQPRGLEYVT